MNSIYPDKNSSISKSIEQSASRIPTDTLIQMIGTVARFCEETSEANEIRKRREEEDLRDFKSKIAQGNISPRTREALMEDSFQIYENRGGIVRTENYSLQSSL
jgi:hypothetical protein